MTEEHDHDRDPVRRRVRGPVRGPGAGLSRRRVLGLAALAGGGAVLGACGDPPPGSDRQATVVGRSANGSDCVAAPEAIPGPFQANGSNRANGAVANVLTETGVIRSDLRPSFGGRTGMADGVPFDVTLTLQNVAGGCAPLAGYAVYLWHCDAAGLYSVYEVETANYLRGVGVSDVEGVVRFRTIVPGCHPGRYPHMSFEVYPSLPLAKNYRNRLLSSQLAMPQGMIEAAYAADARYAESRRHLPRLPLGRDRVFADNSPRQLAALTPVAAGDPASGYTGAAVIGLSM